MEKTTGNDSKSMTEQLAAAKLMLIKYNILHSAIVFQLENYPIACCDIAIDGLVEVDVNSHTLTYKVYSVKEFFLKGKTAVKRDKFSPVRYFKVFPKKYKKQAELAKKNLSEWSKNLMWPDTKVKVFFDEKEV